MARIKVTTKVTGIKDWNKISDISTYDIAFSEGATVRNRRVSGGYTFKKLGNKMVDEARERIVAAKKFDTGLMWSSVRHIWKIESFDKMSFSLLMGTQGGEADSIATAFTNTQFGSRSGWVDYEGGLARVKQLNVYAAVWESEYKFIESTVMSNRELIEKHYLEAYEDAVFNKGQGSI